MCCTSIAVDVTGWVGVHVAGATGVGRQACGDGGIVVL